MEAIREVAGEGLTRTNRPCRLRWRVPVAAVLAAGAFAAVYPFDTGILALVARLPSTEPAGFFDQVLSGLKNFAQVLTIATACIVVGLFDKRRRFWIITAILAAQFFAIVGYDGTKSVVARHRPVSAEKIAPFDELKPDRTWVGWKPGNDGYMLASFPSGHTAAAFALAMVLAWYYPPLWWWVWPLAIGCGASRVITFAHWPSDCVVGAGLGYVCGCLGVAIVARIARGRSQ